MAQENTNEYYSISFHEPRGCLVIVNNEKFRTMKPRCGSSKDADDLKKVFFEKFHFEVIREDNLTKNEIMCLMKRVAQKDYSEIGCLIIVLLSHGLQGAIYSSDEDIVYLSDVADVFKAKSCHALERKPKVLIMPGCQNEIPPRQLTKIPNEEHYLIVYSTLPGCSAMRDTKDGSWFIQELINALWERGDTDHLVNILTAVADRVDKICIEDKQVPNFDSSLKRKLRLTPTSTGTSISSQCPEMGLYHDLKLENASLVYSTTSPQDYTKLIPSSKSLPLESAHLPNIPVHSLLLPLSTELNRSNSKAQPFNSELPLHGQSLEYEEQLLDECYKEEEQEAPPEIAFEKENTASVKQSQTEVTSLDPSMEHKEAKVTITPPISIIPPLASGVPSLTSPPLSGMLVPQLCTEDEEWVILDNDDWIREDEWVLLEEKDWEGEIDETEWVIVNEVLQETCS